MDCLNVSTAPHLHNPSHHTHLHLAQEKQRHFLPVKSHSLPTVVWFWPPETTAQEFQVAGFWSGGSFALSTVLAKTASTSAGNLQIAFLRWSVDKGCGCPGKTCLSPAGGDKECWNGAKGHRPQGKVKQPSTVLFFASLVFFHFHISVSLSSPHYTSPRPRHVLWGKVKWCFLEILCTLSKLGSLAAWREKGTVNTRSAHRAEYIPEKSPVASPATPSIPL